MQVYSLSAVAFLFGGIPATGFGEGDAFTISKKDATFSTVVGVGGEVVRCYTGSKLFEIKLTLLQTSPYNDYLSGIYNADILSSDAGQGGSGVLPFGMKDFNGTTLAAAPKCWIVKPPDIKRKDKISDNEWTLEADGVQYFVGGQAA